MVDLYTHPSIRRLVDEVLEVKHVMLSEIVEKEFMPINVDTLDNNERRNDFPRSFVVEPVFEDFVDGSEIVAFIIGIIPWDSYFVDALPFMTSMEVKVEDKCGAEFSLLIDGPSVHFLGYSYQHDETKRQISAEFAEFARYEGGSVTNAILEECSYTLTVYPTSTFAESYKTNRPIVNAILSLAVFLFTTLVFLSYDMMVERRQRKVLSNAQQTNAIIDNLFPKDVKQRMMEEVKETARVQNDRLKKRGGVFGSKNLMQDHLAEGEVLDQDPLGKKTRIGKPIADLYAETTILFADLVGFTAWSSTREPSSVFELLETVFGEFDRLAKKHRVFKVETGTSRNSYLVLSTP